MSLDNTITGASVATGKYRHCITEQFPTLNKTYKVDSSVSTTLFRDFLPINANIADGSINGSYAEFNLISSDGEFFDLESFALEAKIRIIDGEGNNITADANVSLIDGFGHRLISRQSLYLNGSLVEQNSYFGLYNAIKTYLTMPRSALSTSGRNMLYKSLETPIHDVISLNSFTAPSITEVLDQKRCLKVIHTVTPLLLDVSSSGQYLLNSCDARLRLDLSPASLLINSHDSEKYGYKIEALKLWTKKIVPNSNALMSLNKSLLRSNRSIEYLFQRPIVKTYVFPAGQNMLSMDNIFNGIIPNRVHFCMLRQASANGSQINNGAYLTHGSLSSIRLEVNGNIISSFQTDFKNEEIAHLFHHNILNNDCEDNLITYNNFIDGRTIYTWQLAAKECEGTLPIEKMGNLRMTLQTAGTNLENLVIFIFGLTSALLEIDAGRRVRTSYLM